MKIDNYALTMHQTCPAKYDMRMRQHWTAKGKSAALSAGGALHSGLAEWYRGNGLPAAVLAIKDAWPEDHPVDDWRTLGKVVETMILYSKEYPAELFRVVGLGSSPMVEVSFTLDTGLWLSCIECGPDHSVEADQAQVGLDGQLCCSNCDTPFEPIQYGGIFDTLVEQGPNVYVLEHKTTSVMGKYYFNQFKPNNQITGYIWAAGLLSGRRVGGAIANALGWYKSQGTKFARELTTRTPSEIEEWKLNVKAVCEEIRFHERHGYWPQRTGSCVMYGQCEYRQVCTQIDPKTRGKMLEQMYRQSKWDYEDRD